MKLTTVLGLATIAWVSYSYSVVAAESATVTEVQDKVKAAAEAIAKAEDKKAVLAEFDGKNPNWAWKDSYVFVMDCKADKAIAHPTLAGKTIMDLKDKAGTLVMGGDKGLCKAAEQVGGGWTAYMWAKPGSSEAANKVSFAMKVKGTDYEVAAGVYADKKVENFKLVK